jgi:7,8-dihydropterin-6-yl-methyl-4-(beta-D-ribofuranosyl)aminobenzene 5'-phosphate synthase
MPIPEVDRVSITTVVDNSIDSLRADEKVARRFTHARARKMPTLRAEHGLAHWVEVTRGRETRRLSFDWGLTDASYVHNLRELGLDPAGLDALVLSHGHQDHWGGLPGFLRACRPALAPAVPLYAGQDHFLPRYNERHGDRVYIGRLDREDLGRQDLDIRVVQSPTVVADAVMLSGEMQETMPFEVIPPSLRVERDGAVIQDTFIGEQSMFVNVRDRGLVVVTSCSHRGIVGICRHATRVTGVPRVHAVIGGFHLSGLAGERIEQVVDEFRALQVEHIVPQHCTGMEAMVALHRHFPAEVVVSSVGSTFTFEAPDATGER